MGVKIPEGVSVEVKGNALSVKGPCGVLEKTFNNRLVEVRIENDEANMVLKGKSNRRNNAIIKTFEAHLKNMFKGVGEKFEKKLQLVYSHFPVTVEVKGKDVFIKNFLGEKTPRKAKIMGSVVVEVKGQEITVSGSDIGSVGQTASNIKNATRITRRDGRVFQDGIYYA